MIYERTIHMSGPRTVEGAYQARVTVSPLSGSGGVGFNNPISFNVGNTGNTDNPFGRHMQHTFDSTLARLQGENDQDTDKKKGFIVLPGIKGSRLYYDGEDFQIPNFHFGAGTVAPLHYRRGHKLWIRFNYWLGNNIHNAAGGVQTLAEQRVVSNNVLQLACHPNGNSARGVRTAGLNESEFGDNANDDNFGATGFYTNMMHQLRSAYSEEDVIFIPYDWRLGLSVATSEVSQYITDFAKDYDIVYIIAHSLGGLVACNYLRLNPPLKSKCRLITMGTPYFGAPQALNALFTGNALPFNLVSSQIQEIAPNIRSLYDLLPTKQYFDGDSRTYLTQTNTFASARDFTVIEEPKNLTWSQTVSLIKSSFNEALMGVSNEVHEVLGVENVFRELSHSCAVVGFGQRTIQRIFQNIAGGRVPEILTSSDSNGDSTVPLFSQTFGGRIANDRVMYVEEEHGALARNNDIIRFIRAKVLNWDEPQNSSLGFNQNTVRRTLPDGFSINSLPLSSVTAMQSQAMLEAAVQPIVTAPTNQVNQNHVAHWAIMQEDALLDTSAIDTSMHVNTVPATGNNVVSGTNRRVPHGSDSIPTWE